MGKTFLVILTQVFFFDFDPPEKASADFDPPEKANFAAPEDGMATEWVLRLRKEGAGAVLDPELREDNYRCRPGPMASG